MRDRTVTSDETHVVLTSLQREIEGDPGFRATMKDLAWFGQKYGVEINVYISDSETDLGDRVLKTDKLDIYELFYRHVKFIVKEDKDEVGRVKDIFHQIFAMDTLTSGIEPTDSYYRGFYDEVIGVITKRRKGVGEVVAKGVLKDLAPIMLRWKP